MPKKRAAYGDIIVYAAKMRDGTYRRVMAVSWKDAKRFFRSEAVSIRKRVISNEDYSLSMFDDGMAKRDIYEDGEISPFTRIFLEASRRPNPVGGVNLA